VPRRWSIEKRREHEAAWSELFKQAWKWSDEQVRANREKFKSAHPASIVAMPKMIQMSQAYWLKVLIRGICKIDDWGSEVDPTLGFDAVKADIKEKYHCELPSDAAKTEEATRLRALADERRMIVEEIRKTTGMIPVDTIVTIYAVEPRELDRLKEEMGAVDVQKVKEMLNGLVSSKGQQYVEEVLNDMMQIEYARELKGVPAEVIEKWTEPVQGPTLEQQLKKSLEKVVPGVAARAEIPRGKVRPTTLETFAQRFGPERPEERRVAEVAAKRVEEVLATAKEKAEELVPEAAVPQVEAGRVRVPETLSPYAQKLAEWAKGHPGWYIHPVKNVEVEATKMVDQRCLCNHTRKCPCPESIVEVTRDGMCKCRLYVS